MMTPSQQQLITLFQQKQGLLRRQDVLDAGIHPRALTALVQQGQVERVQRGVYRWQASHGFDYDWLLEVSYRVPKGVVCLLSALDFHELTTFIPSDIHMAVPIGSHLPTFDYPSVRLHQFGKRTYPYGIEKHRVGAGVIRVYSVEKTLADMLRLQRRYGLTHFLAALKTYVISQHYHADRLLEAAEVCGVQRSMQTYLQAYVHAVSA